MHQTYRRFLPQDHGFVAGREAFVAARTVRRCLLIQAKVRSTTQRRGSTSKACGLRRATICRRALTCCGRPRDRGPPLCKRIYRHNLR